MLYVGLDDAERPSGIAAKGVAKMRSLEPGTARPLVRRSRQRRTSSRFRRFRPIVDHLASLSLDARQGAWIAFLAGQDDRDEIIMALFEIDPEGPAPNPENSTKAPPLGVRSAS